MAVVLAACGGGSKTATSATTTTPTTATGRGAAAAAYVTCMKNHGVTLPAGTGPFGFGGGGRRGAGAGGGSVPTGGSTPTTGSAPRTFPSTTLPAGVTEAQYQAAQKACVSALPRGGNLANNTQFAAYYNCLNSYLTANGGTTLPPLAQGGGLGGLFGRGGPGAADGSSPSTTSNPMLAAAMAHCVALRPTFAATTTTTTA
jgi:hypothetical protein